MCLVIPRKTGVSAAAHAVVEQDQTATQGLVCAKTRLARQNLTISRLEPLAGHTAVNLSQMDSRRLQKCIAG